MPTIAPPTNEPPRRLRLACATALLAAGVAGLARGLPTEAWRTFLTLGPWSGGLPLVAFAAVVAVVSTLPPVGRTVDAVAARGGNRRRLVTVGVGLLTVTYLLRTAQGQGRPFRPSVHDEFSYLVQAHQLAAGHGWMPVHPLGPFFDSFQLLMTPAYASAYFPGTALLYVPGVWLGVPPWVTSLIIAGVVAALLFHVTAELLDPAWAAAAVLLLWADRPYRAMATMTLAQLPLLMDGLIATAAWLAWRRRPRWPWAAVAGLALALAGVTRPVDALCFAVPIGLDVAGRLWRSPRRVVAATLLAAALPAVPVLALQLTLDRGITGHALQTPFRLYADRDYPGSAYGFHPFDPAARPASPLPQKRAMFDAAVPAIRRHTPGQAAAAVFGSRVVGGRVALGRLPMTLTQSSVAPLPVLLPLAAVALLGLTRRRAVVLAVLPLFVGLYAGYVFFLAHYVVTAAAAVAVAVVAGAADLAAALPTPPARRVARAFLWLSIAGLSVAALPQWRAGTGDALLRLRTLPRVDAALAALPPGPAVVLFTYSPTRSADEEPVYNPDVAWPDDAPVVRAHDLGPARDAELFRYYAARQPERMAYRYDEADDTITPLGRVDALARR